MKQYFTANIKYLRELRKLKQSDLSTLLGLRQSTWSGYEKGSFYPKFNDLLLISDFFKISLDNLIFSDLSDATIQRKNKNEVRPEDGSFFVLLSIKDELIIQLKENMENKDAIISSKEETIGLLRQILISKEDEIKKMKQEIEEIKKTVDSHKINDHRVAN